MATKNEPVDNLLEALVWMRRKAKKHEAVDDLIDALMKMRRKAKKKTSKRKLPKKKKPQTSVARRAVRRDRDGGLVNISPSRSNKLK